jgi:uncharacterized protein DUF4232
MGRRAVAAVLIPVVVLLAACDAGTTHVIRSTPSSSSTTESVSPASTNPEPTSTSAVVSSAPLCTNGQVGVSDSGGGAGLGHEDQVILFTNHSPSPCTLTGYPGVAGLDANGEQVVQAVRALSGYLGGLWNDARTPPRVSLNPGQTASAIVEGTDNPTGTATSCPSYDHLLVTPPNLTDSVRVSVSGLGSPPTSGLPGCSIIEVHPVVPGNSGTVQ